MLRDVPQQVTPTTAPSTTAPPPKAAARRGRPRSAATDRVILDAVRALLVEHGYSGLTIEGVAARAGVAKTTLYRRWTTKADLVVDAVVDTLAPLFATPEDAAPADLLRTLADALAQPEARAAFLTLVSEAATDPLLREHANRRLIEPSRLLVARCAAKVTTTIDGDLLFDVIAGTVIHRVLVLGREADDAFIADLLALVSPAGSLPPAS
jgi:AcrR family transcriptional regulator